MEWVAELLLLSIPQPGRGRRGVAKNSGLVKYSLNLGLKREHALPLYLLQPL